MKAKSSSSVGTAHLTIDGNVNSFGPTENKQQLCGSPMGGGGESAGCVAVRHRRVLVGGFGRSGAVNPGTLTDGDGKLNPSVQLWGSHQSGGSLTFLFLTHLCPQVKGS